MSCQSLQNYFETTTIMNTVSKNVNHDSIDEIPQRLNPDMNSLSNVCLHFNKCRFYSNDEVAYELETYENPSHVSTPSKSKESNHNTSPKKCVLSNAIHRSPSHRRLRVRTLDDAQQLGKTERTMRLTDSMLEDAFIADKLKMRLGSRREIGSCRRTIQDSMLSDFIKKSIMGGSLSAFSVVQPTHEQLNTSADLAMKVCLQGYFENIEEEEVKTRVRQIFMESLIREEYHNGDYICRQNDIGDKLFIVEEGIVQFEIGKQIAGTAQNGAVFGELSLVYGIPRSADVRAVTPIVMLWSLDALSFRRIQSLVAENSLRLSYSEYESAQSCHELMQKYRRQYSSLSDLQEPSSSGTKEIFDFHKLHREAVIGKGTFGRVYLVSTTEFDNEDSGEKQFYALKCMTKTSIVERKNKKRVLIEKNVLQELNSPFIISLVATYQDTKFIYFLTDFVQGGNLMSYMIRKDTLSNSECVFFSANIVLALVHMHKKGIIHRDMKPENCLIDRNGYIKLCDFGMAKRLPSTVYLANGRTEVVTLAFTMCGTPEFMGPEFVLSTGYDKNIDLWALGCMLVEMHTARSPFEYGDLKRTFKEVCLIGMGKHKYRAPIELQQEEMKSARRFIEGLICPVSMRLGMKDTLDVTRHEYFSRIDFQAIEDRSIIPPYVPSFQGSNDVSYFHDDDWSSENEEDGTSGSFEDDESWCIDF